MRQDIHTNPPMVEASVSKEDIPTLYGQLAWLYDAFTDFEPSHHQKAIEMADIQPGESVLEVACGTGRATLEIAPMVNQEGAFSAVDITPAMLERARRRLTKAGLIDRVDLRLADATYLPYPDASFDLLYNAYMMDLIDTGRVPHILDEFKRVLKPGGRLVMVNMSKNRPGRTLYEFLYEKGLLGFASGGCRPVLTAPYLEQAGFRDIQREFRKHRSFFFLNWLTGTEIVTAVR